MAGLRVADTDSAFGITTKFLARGVVELGGLQGRDCRCTERTGPDVQTGHGLELAANQAAFEDSQSALRRSPWPACRRTFRYPILGAEAGPTPVAGELRVAGCAAEAMAQFVSDLVRRAEHRFGGCQATGR